MPMQNQKRLATIRELPNLYPSFSQNAIRWLIFNKKSNGFAVCMRRVGRKIIIDLDSFEQWIDGKQEDIAS